MKELTLTSFLWLLPSVLTFVRVLGKNCKPLSAIGLAMVMSSTASFGQAGVGIGVTNPDPSATLHVQPPGAPKGLLIPRLTSSERANIASPAEGLLVYDITLRRFCFYYGGWMVLNEMERAAGSTAVSHSGSLTVSEGISAGGNLNVTGMVTAADFSGDGIVPTGGIIMWSGATPPVGWALCDGQNGTPDLRGRFIVGYHPAANDYNDPGSRSTQGAAGAQGKTGGSADVALTLAQIPSHSHSYNRHGSKSVGKNSGGGEDAADHGSTVAATSGSAGGVFVPGAPIYDYSGTPCGYTDPNTGIRYPSGCNPNYGQQVATQPSTYETQPHENRPPYYVLAFIMKL
jgi:microcystin-dependent protein